MRRAAIVIFLALIGFLGNLTIGTGAATASPASVESDFVSRLNGLRVSKGLAPLTVDSELTSIGRRWAGKMAAAGQISHNSNYPNEVTANWTKLGENVGTGPDAKSIHDAFVRSSTHYKNMVDPAFTRIGVGVVVGSDGAIYTAHQFMRLASDDAAAAPVAVAPAPAPARAARSTAPAPAPRPRAAAPRPARVPKAAPAVAAAPAPAAPAVVPARIALSLEQLQGRGL